jgi:hypothetical protein
MILRYGSHIHVPCGIIASKCYRAKGVSGELSLDNEPCVAHHIAIVPAHISGCGIGY